jgi:hypothetical protein
MKILLMFVLRALFLPISLGAMAMTAAVEVMGANPDWKFWRQQNRVLIDILPWARYKSGEIN